MLSSAASASSLGAVEGRGTPRWDTGPAGATAAPLFEPNAPERDAGAPFGFYDGAERADGATAAVFSSVAADSMSDTRVLRQDAFNSFARVRQLHPAFTHSPFPSAADPCVAADTGVSGVRGEEMPAVVSSPCASSTPSAQPFAHASCKAEREERLKSAGATCPCIPPELTASLPDCSAPQTAASGTAGGGMSVSSPLVALPSPDSDALSFSVSATRPTFAETPAEMQPSDDSAVRPAPLEHPLPSSLQVDAAVLASCASLPPGRSPAGVVAEGSTSGETNGAGGLASGRTSPRASPPQTPVLATPSSPAASAVPPNCCLRCLQEYFLSSPSFACVHPRSSDSRVHTARVKCFAMLEALKRHAPAWAEDEVVPTAYHGLMTPYAYHTARVFCCPPADLSAYNEIFGRWLAKIAFLMSTERLSCSAESAAVSPGHRKGDDEAPAETCSADARTPACQSPATASLAQVPPRGEETVEAETAEDGARSAAPPPRLPQDKTEGASQSPRGEGTAAKRARDDASQSPLEGERHPRKAPEPAAAGDASLKGSPGSLQPDEGRPEGATPRVAAGQTKASQDASELCAELARRLDAAELPSVFDGHLLWPEAGGTGGAGGVDGDCAPAAEWKGEGEGAQAGAGACAQQSLRERAMDGSDEDGTDEAPGGGWNLSHFQRNEVRSRLLRFVRLQSKKRRPQPAVVRLQKIHSALVAFLRRYEDAGSHAACGASVCSLDRCGGVGDAFLGEDCEGEKRWAFEAQEGRWRRSKEGAWRGSASGLTPAGARSVSLFSSDSRYLQFSSLRPGILRTFLQTSRLKFIRRQEVNFAGAAGHPLSLDSSFLSGGGEGLGEGLGGHTRFALGDAEGEDGLLRWYQAVRGRGTREDAWRSDSGEPKKKRARLDLARVLLEEEETTAESEGGSLREVRGDAEGAANGYSERGGAGCGFRTEKKSPAKRKYHIACLDYSEVWANRIDDLLDALDELRDQVETAHSAAGSSSRGRSLVRSLEHYALDAFAMSRRSFFCPLYRSSSAADSIVRLHLPAPGVRRLSVDVFPPSPARGAGCAVDGGVGAAGVSGSLLDVACASPQDADACSPSLASRISPTDISRASGLLERQQLHFPFSAPDLRPPQASAARAASPRTQVPSRCRVAAVGGSSRRSGNFLGKRAPAPSEGSPAGDLASALLFADQAGSGPLPKKLRRVFVRHAFGVERALPREEARDARAARVGVRSRDETHASGGTLTLSSPGPANAPEKPAGYDETWSKSAEKADGDPAAHAGENGLAARFSSPSGVRGPSAVTRSCALRSSRRFAARAASAGGASTPVERGGGEGGDKRISLRSAEASRHTPSTTSASPPAGGREERRGVEHPAELSKPHLAGGTKDQGQGSAEEEEEARKASDGVCSAESGDARPDYWENVKEGTACGGDGQATAGTDSAEHRDATHRPETPPQAMRAAGADSRSTSCLAQKRDMEQCSRGSGEEGRGSAGGKASHCSGGRLAVVPSEQVKRGDPDAARPGDVTTEAAAS
ncbi:hypothetical protein BESB_075060 [Besnoitia besnoiti]|uniref:Uncharacterized protein n=1 Tax=Besnoitia besnoiti TaxID=94643 RepID=A0A2A9MAY1_BESBE|nr:uncharacterized protein BESB_075060 [Besnoitia besnoiti]PFH34354.1 hypothetical protein BESB_075060 [Besnoitia besnoiti]